MRKGLLTPSRQLRQKTRTTRALGRTIDALTQATDAIDQIEAAFTPQTWLPPVTVDLGAITLTNYHVPDATFFQTGIGAGSLIFFTTSISIVTAGSAATTVGTTVMFTLPTVPLIQNVLTAYVLNNTGAIVPCSAFTNIGPAYNVWIVPNAGGAGWITDGMIIRVTGQYISST